jgi:hypothetical protein
LFLSGQPAVNIEKLSKLCDSKLLSRALSISPMAKKHGEKFENVVVSKRKKYSLHFFSIRS